MRQSRETGSIHSLISLDKLVEDKQGAVPTAIVLGLQVQAYFVHNSGPASREIVFNDGS